MCPSSRTNSMEHNPPWEADSSTAIQQNFRTLWKAKVQYRVHNTSSDHVS